MQEDQRAFHKLKNRQDFREFVNKLKLSVSGLFYLVIFPLFRVILESSQSSSQPRFRLKASGVSLQEKSSEYWRVGWFLTVIPIEMRKECASQRTSKTIMNGLFSVFPHFIHRKKALGKYAFLRFATIFEAFKALLLSLKLVHQKPPEHS